MDMDERWVNRSPETMLETFHWFHGEGFDLIVDDLLRLPAATGGHRRGLPAAATARLSVARRAQPRGVAPADSCVPPSRVREPWHGGVGHAEPDQ